MAKQNLMTNESKKLIQKQQNAPQHLKRKSQPPQARSAPSSTSPAIDTPASAADNNTSADTQKQILTLQQQPQRDRKKSTSGAKRSTKLSVVATTNDNILPVNLPPATTRATSQCDLSLSGNLTRNRFTSHLLPRKVLKWLQAQRIQFNPQTIRRDFSNGVLVAMVAKRYLPSDISLHNYENSDCSTRKWANWKCLLRAFRRNGYCDKISTADECAKPLPQVDEKLCRAVMMQKDGAAEVLISRLYELFTGHELHSNLPFFENDLLVDELYQRSLPFYARQTAATAIRSHMLASDYNPEIGAGAFYDNGTEKASMVVEGHRRWKRMLRYEQLVRTHPRQPMSKRAAARLGGVRRTGIEFVDCKMPLPFRPAPGNKAKASPPTTLTATGAAAAAVTGTTNAPPPPVPSTTEVTVK